MQKLTFVIGANAAGKTYFIEHHLANEKAVALNIYDYQQTEIYLMDAISDMNSWKCISKSR